MDSEHVITVCLNQFATGDRQRKAEAALVLCRERGSQTPQYWSSLSTRLLELNAVPGLLEIISGNDVESHSAYMWMNLSSDKRFRTHIAKHHLDAALARLLTCCDPRAPDVARRAATAINNLGVETSIAKAAAAAGGMTKLVALLGSEAPHTTRLAAVNAIHSLAQRSETRARQALQAGALPAMADLCTSTTAADVHCTTTKAMWNILQQLKPDFMSEGDMQQCLDTGMHVLRQHLSDEAASAGCYLIQQVLLPSQHWSQVAKGSGFLELAAGKMRGASSTLAAFLCDLLQMVLRTASKAEMKAVVDAGVIEAAVGHLAAASSGVAASTVTTLLLMLAQAERSSAKRAAAAGALPGVISAVRTEPEAGVQKGMLILIEQMLEPPVAAGLAQQAADAGAIALALLHMRRPDRVTQRVSYGILQKLAAALKQRSKQQQALQQQWVNAAEQLVQHLRSPAAEREVSSAALQDALSALCSMVYDHAAVAEAAAGAGVRELAARAAGREQQQGEDVRGEAAKLARVVDHALLGIPLQPGDAMQIICLEDQAAAAGREQQPWIDPAVWQQQQEQPACARCRAEHKEGGAPLYRCSACRQVHYCSRQCQREHWGEHKRACRAQVAAPQVKVDATL